MIYDFIVIGAGLSGLLVADNLEKSGYAVLVIEKSKSSGGRLATRRIESFFCDHGLQFFDSKDLSDQFLNFSNNFLKKNEQGYYFSAQGMTEIPKKIALSLNITYNEKIKKIDKTDLIYTVRSESGNTYQSRSVISAVPWTQFRDLMITSQLTDDVLDSKTIIYSQCLVAFVKTDKLNHKKQTHFSIYNQALKYDQNPFTVVQAGSHWSETYFDNSDDSIKKQFASDLDLDITDIVDIKKWRYANCQNTLDTDHYENKKYPYLFAVGDYFKHRGVQSVFLSVNSFLNKIRNVHLQINS